MTLIDDRGRLFGRVNLVDAGIAVLAVGTAAGLFTAFRVFRLPRGPEIASVEPATQPAVTGAQLRLRGRDFLPYERVFVNQSGASPGFVHGDEKPADEFTLVNQTRAPWVVESPSLASVSLPDRMAPGTYDLIFYNETRQLSIARAAFTLTSVAPPPVQPPDLADAAGEADVTVRFVLRPAEAAQMKAGDLDAADDTQARRPRRAATLASIAARADVTRRTYSTAGGHAQWIEEPAVRVDAVLRVPVTRLDGVWFYKGQALKSGGTIAFETPIYKARAWVLNVAARRTAKGRSSE